ncbi:MAG: PD40 domain-containing protein [Anaerolineaceae bacterium]|nr:PD40 domain-containing protein [Anaerolineaceae bacterium]
MLLRAYRITDRFGILLLKMAEFIYEWLIGSGSSLVIILKRILGGILALVMVILGVIWKLLRAILGVILGILGFVVSALLGLFGVVTRTGTKATGAMADRASQGATGAMARRAARAEVDVIVTEDPLKVQNRRLSVLVMAFGAIAIAAILYATDQSRNSSPVTTFTGSGADAFVIDATQVPTQSGLAAIATPIPTATTVPEVLQVGGTIAFTVRERGQTDIWAVEVGSRQPIRIISSSTDDRDPKWNLQGDRLAFASRRDGNWELYFFDISAPGADPTANIQRLTYDLAFQAAPSWSDDGQWVVSENYQENNLDIVARRIDGSQVVRLTTDAAPDFSPVWSPNGRQVAFVSWRDGNQDIYLVDLNSQAVTNLTQTPEIEEDYPAFSPDGRLIAYSSQQGGQEQVSVIRIDQPGTGQVVSIGRMPTWSPDGLGLAYIADAIDNSRSFIYVMPYQTGGAPLIISEVPFGADHPTWVDRSLPPALVSAGGVDLAVTTPLYTEQIQDRATGLVGLQSITNTQAQNAFLSDSVNDSFDAMRQRLVEESGWDFLAQMDDLFWNINRLGEPGVPDRNWHKTGRAFSLDRNALLGFPPEIEVVREEVGPLDETYWRVYIRVDEDLQSGQLGEPLRRLPWDFLTRNQDIEAYNQGGRVRASVPTGYYVDFTQLAADYGWERMPAGETWRANADTRFFWMFFKPEGMSWVDAMLEIYTPGEMGGFLPTPTASAN